MAKANQPGPSEPKPPRQGTGDQANALTASHLSPQPFTVSHAYQVSNAPQSGSVRQVPQIPGYEIMGELGRGGMGVVYKAQHLQLKRVVALKVILTGGHASAAELSRFRTEAEAVARLRHPGIVQIFDIGEHDGLPYFSLEFCGGGSLAQRLQSGPPMRLKQVARLVEQLARAMQEAHEQSVVHRDLKPANVLLTDPAESKPDKQRPLGKPKITDFGLAKRLDSSMGQTQTGAVMGTPSYMSPEQAGGSSRAVGPRADIYALGAILYECLTGRPPFEGATPLETIKQVVGAAPLPPRQKRRGVPRDLEVICLKCLRKDPAQRYKTATDLADDLRSYLNGEPISARAVGPLERSAKWLVRHALAVGLIAVFVLLLTSLVVLWGKYSQGERQRRELAERTGQLEETMRQADALKEAQEPQKTWAGQLGLNVEEDVMLGEGNISVTFKLMLIPPGKFLMGSPQVEEGRHDGEGQHEVTISKPFYVGKYEVTQEQYAAVTGQNPSHFKKVQGQDTRQFPVEEVSWEDAVAFCGKLTEKAGAGRGKFDLPTEAQWEYACRAGTQTPYHFGSNLNGREANCRGNDPHGTTVQGRNLERTCRVGSYEPNAWGLFDMHGNVSEWCKDWHEKYDPTQRVDPVGPNWGSLRVIRGGGWNSGARFCRSASRNAYWPVIRSSDQGFRVALVPSGSK